MKKLTSIILALTMLLSCAALVGCGVKNVPGLGKINYSENFTDKDIAFLIALEQSDPKNNSDKGIHFADEVAVYLHLWNVIRRTQEKKSGLYYAKNDLDNPYYICFYQREGALYTILRIIDALLGTNLNTVNTKWYKFDNLSFDKLPEEIDGMKLNATYALFNGSILRDVAEGTEQSIDYTFYVKTWKGFSANHVYKDMLVYRQYGLPYIDYYGGEYLFLSYTNRPYCELEAPLYARYNGLYIAFSSEHENIYDNELIQYHFEIYYDTVIPYFEALEEFEDRYTFGLRVDTLERILFREWEENDGDKSN